MVEIHRFIRDIPDFPKEGILFKDITPLLKDPGAFDETIRQLADPFREENLDAVIGIESRGFIFGAALARELGVGFIPIRKPGKLPADTISASYDLEYGTDNIEIHKDAIDSGDRVLLTDDLLATGGTMEAAYSLVENLGGDIVGVSFVIELGFLSGRERLGDLNVMSLIEYD